MRWKQKSTPTPQVGDTRVRNHFLWFPLTINKETRWLETCIYEERYIDWYDEVYPFGPISEWRASKWLT